MTSNEMFSRDQLNDLGGGEYTVTVDPGSGAVLSINPNGGEETRPKGTTGPWERCKIQGNVLVFRPAGARAFFFGLANVWPNS